MSGVKITDAITIGGENPCFIIAEIGQNHQGDMEMAKELIKAAKDAGADCAKFQKTCLKEKFTSSYLLKPYDNANSWGKTYGEHKQYLEFTEAEFEELADYARKIGIIFTASAMDIVSFDFLVNLKVPFIKIGSGDSNNKLLIQHAASKHIPLVISTGMIGKSAVKDIYNMVATEHKDFCLLHCVSAYPTPYEDVNLRVIEDFTTTFDVPVGYSGHELGTSVPVAAVALGAKVIEKHFTLDKTMKGTDHVCSLTPEEFRRMTRDIRTVEDCLGVKSVKKIENFSTDTHQKTFMESSCKTLGDVLNIADVQVNVSIQE